MRRARRQTSGSDEISRSRGRTSIDAGAAVQIHSTLAGSERARGNRDQGVMIQRRDARMASDDVQPPCVPQVPAGFFGAAFCALAGAGGGPGARSIETSRPPTKR